MFPNFNIRRKLLKKTLSKPFLFFDILWAKELKNRFGGSFTKNLMKTAGALDTLSKLVLIGSGLIGATAAGMELYEQIKKRKASDRIFKNIVKKDPYLSQLPEEELNDYYRTIKEVSPTIASNPLLLRTALKQMATYEGADPNSILMMSKLESEIKNNTIYDPIYRLSEKITFAGKALENYGKD